MTLVPLHDHVELMREHLREGQFADVITLGKHVLRHYPKHLETYRLLAEASLETGDLNAAADLFQRVRSADPENIVALVGLSIVHEQRKQIEEAIWHLERAFEIQPANGELRQELLRLYAEQEGTPRERLKLTPGGLARLYARQGLYSQAIQEFRALLARDPARLDIQAALAETLYRVGRKQESAEIAQELLDKLPYCLKANLLLGAMWAENGVPEAQALFQRAQSLDPENTVARALLPDHWDDAPPPMLPALVQEPAESAPSSAVKLDEAAGREAFWLESLLPDTEPTAEAEASAAQMGQEETPPAEEQPPQSTLAAASPAPQEAAQSFMPAEPTLVDPVASAVSPVPYTGTLPEAARPEVELALPQAETAAASEEDVPPPQVVEQQPRTIAAPPESTPAQSEETAEPIRRMQPSIPRVGPTIPGALEKLPAWLFMGSKVPAEETAPAPSAGLQESDAIVATRLAAIRQAQKERAPMPPDLPSHAGRSAKEAEATASDMPEWLTRARQAVRSGQSEENVAASNVPEEKPAWLTQGTDDSASGEQPTATPEWLRAGTTGQVAQSPGQAEDVLPAWLAAPDPDSQAETPSPDAPLPGWLIAANESGPAEAHPSPEAPPTWLQNPRTETHPETPSVERQVPEWLQTPATSEFEGASTPEDRTPEGENVTGAELDETIPEWLREIMEAKEEPSVESAQTAEAAGPELPEAKFDHPVQPPQVELSEAQAELEPAMPEQVTPVMLETAPALEAVVTPTASETAGSTPVAPAISAEPSSTPEAGPPQEPLGNSPLEEASQAVPEPQPQFTVPDSPLTEARQMWASGDKSGAIGMYEQALQSGPAITPEVIADFERFVQETDAPMPAHRLLGDAYSTVGRYKEALDQYRLVLGK